VQYTSAGHLPNNWGNHKYADNVLCKATKFGLVTKLVNAKFVCGIDMPPTVEDRTPEDQIILGSAVYAQTV